MSTYFYTFLCCIILFLIVSTFLTKQKEYYDGSSLTRTTCKRYNLTDVVVSKTNYDPYLEISNEDFQQFLDTSFNRYKLDMSSIKPSTVPLSQSTAETIATRFVDTLNTAFRLSPLHRESDLFKLIEFCPPIKYGQIDNQEYSNLYITIYRTERNYGYQLSVDSLSTLSINKTTYYNVKIIGNILEQDIIGLPPVENTVYDENNPKDNDGKKVVLKKSEQAQYLLDFIDNKKKFVSEKGFHCYGQPYYDREKKCVSYYDKYGKPKKEGRGYWDKQCTKNEECPFWRANKNYTNTRGGCVDGWCEMPVNIKQVSYKQYTIDTKPYCYNCDEKDDMYECCENQKEKNRDSYTLLASPDYAFAGDISERQQHIDELRERELLPTSTKRMIDRL